MNLRTQVLSSLQWLAAARLVGQGIVWLITLRVIQLLEPADFGLMALTLVPIGFFAVFDEMGLGAALIQKKELEAGIERRVVGALFAVHLAIYVVLAAGAPLWAAFYDEPRLTGLLQVVSLKVPIMALGTVPEALLRRRMAFRDKSLADFAGAVSNSVATLVAAVSGLGVWSLVIGTLAGAVVRSVGMMVAARMLPIPSFSMRGVGALVGFGGGVLATRLLWFLFNQSDILVLGKFLDGAALGVYTVAMTIATMPMQKVAGMLNEVGFAAYSRIQSDRAAVASHYLKTVRILGLVAFPVFWGIAAIAPEIVELLDKGKEEARWGGVVEPLGVLAMIVPLRMLATLTAPALLGVGKPWIAFVNQGVSLALMVPAFIFGAQRGLTGVAYAWVIGYPVLFATMLSWSAPALGVGFVAYARRLVAPVLGGGIMIAGVWLAREYAVGGVGSLIVRLVALIACGALAYGAFFLTARRDDLREVIGLVRR